MQPLSANKPCYFSSPKKHKLGTKWRRDKKANMIIRARTASGTIKIIYHRWCHISPLGGIYDHICSAFIIAQEKMKLRKNTSVPEKDASNVEQWCNTNRNSQYSNSTHVSFSCVRCPVRSRQWWEFSSQDVTQNIFHLITPSPWFTVTQILMKVILIINLQTRTNPICRKMDDACLDDVNLCWQKDIVWRNE